MDTEEMMSAIRDLQNDYIQETCQEILPSFNDIKNKYNGKVLKFLKNKGMYFVINNIDLYYENSVKLDGIRIVGFGIVENEHLILPQSELKDEYFQLLEYNEFPEEYKNFIDYARECAKNKKELERKREEETAKAVAEAIKQLKENKKDADENNND